MKHVVHFSAGLGSFWALYRAIQKYGIENVVVLFADTFIEDDDAYRFLVEALSYLFAAPDLKDGLIPLNIPVLDDMAQRKVYLRKLGATIMARLPQFVHLVDGRQPWELFRDERMIGHSNADLCSRVLKRELLDAWRKANTTPETATFYLGIDWTEAHRMFGSGEKPGGMRAIFAPWESEAPMTWEPLWMKDKMAAELAKLGIERPDLYKEGFPHNNCGGFCVKGGLAHFQHLWRRRPWLYDWHERQERAARQEVPELAEYAVLKRRDGGGPRRSMSLEEFRLRLEAHETFDHASWGACACAANPDDYSDEEAA